MPAHVANHLSRDELTYYDTYNKLVSKYSTEAVKCNIDITTGLTPPTELFVEVRVLEDCGEVVLPESGVVNLKKNTTHYLKRGEIEKFIKSNALTIIG
jgi:GINS complex subunit 1